MDKESNLKYLLMKVNSLIQKELEILSERLYKESNRIADNLSEHDSSKTIKELRQKPTFGKLIYSITRGLKTSEITKMSDDDMLKHIRKVQQQESEL